MKNPLPNIFAAWYVPDPTVGGLVAALQAQSIDSLAIARDQRPKDWIPEWVQEAHRVEYFLLVKWSYNARFIAHRDCPLEEWVAEKKIALLPKARFRLFRRGE